MTIAELFQSLSYGELSNLALSLEGSGEIRSKDQPRILQAADEDDRHASARRAADQRRGRGQQRPREALARSRAVAQQQRHHAAELVATVAQEAIDALLLSARHITVRVHPDDQPLVAQGAADVLQARSARLIADPAIARGGCLVDSDIASVDGTVASRWRRAAASLAWSSWRKEHGAWTTRPVGLTERGESVAVSSGVWVAAARRCRATLRPGSCILPRNEEAPFPGLLQGLL